MSKRKPAPDEEPKKETTSDEESGDETNLVDEVKKETISNEESGEETTPGDQSKKEKTSDEESRNETNPGGSPSDDPGDSPNDDPGDSPKGNSVFRTVIGAAVTAGLAVAVPPLVISMLGFTGAGIATGSIAAKMMSAAAIANGGGVAAGSTVAVLQSVGAAGFSLGTNIGLGTAGAVTGAWLSQPKKSPNDKPNKDKNPSDKPKKK